MNRILILTFLFSPFLLFSQEQKASNAGNFSLGIRSTVSAFNHSRQADVGTGFGGQFHLQFSDRVNSEWFADYVTSNISNRINRQDVHIGWSVMYYLIDTKDFTRPVTPYILAGHCFDYTSLKDQWQVVDKKDRWSAAIQAGLGTHFNLSPKLDLSITAQYMLHLGNHLDVHLEGEHVHGDDVAFEEVSFDAHKGGGVEGHLLFNISLNYKLADLW